MHTLNRRDFLAALGCASSACRWVPCPAAPAGKPGPNFVFS